MNAAVSVMAILFSVLTPQKCWFTPTQPLTVNIKADTDVTLVLTDFLGKPIAAKGSTDVASGKSADIKSIFPAAAEPGTYVLYAVAKGQANTSGAPKDFLGTPLVIETFRKESEPGAMVFHVLPLQYALVTTAAGPMTMMFYYDVAPHTVDNFLDLASKGYYDGVIFHRVVPGFVIQGGDPTGTGMGGPGYQIDAEFNARPHQEGVLSMARTSNPNSAGSQFFVCLDYAQTKQLDNQYTAFGKVTDGMDAVKKIAAGKLADPAAGKPESPIAMDKVEVLPVTAKTNPYEKFMTAK